MRPEVRYAHGIKRGDGGTYDWQSVVWHVEKTIIITARVDSSGADSEEFDDKQNTNPVCRITEVL